MDDKKSIKEMVNNAKKFIEMLMQNTPFPIEIQYTKYDRIVSSVFDTLKLVNENRLVFYKKEEIDKISKHMRTQFYNKQDWQLLNNNVCSGLYFWFRDQIIQMSKINDNSFYGALFFNEQRDNQDEIAFTCRMLSKKEYEDIIASATTFMTERLQELFNKIKPDYEEQIKQIGPGELQAVMNELKKTYEIDEKTGIIKKLIKC